MRPLTSCGVLRMPHTSRRPRASSGRGGRPGPRHGHDAARRSRGPRAPAPRKADPYAGLDQALDASAAAPPPAPATFGELGLDDRLVSELQARDIREPFAIQARTLPAAHRVLVLSAQDKVPVAAEIAGRPGRTLFFVRTKHGADRLAKQLSRAGVDAAAIHGDRNQSQRQRALDAFTAGHPRVLVATDVAARGIHVDDVDLVVQFDPPNDHKDYLHRSGRTARAGASGMVIALVERGQVRDLHRLHDAAGVTAASDEVATGHHVVRQIATSGTPVPPAPLAKPSAKVTSDGLSAPARRSGSGRRPPRPAANTRDGFARGTAKPARRPQNGHQAQYAKRSALGTPSRKPL